jgi:hypothetical protein
MPSHIANRTGKYNSISSIVAYCIIISENEMQQLVGRDKNAAAAAFVERELRLGRLCIGGQHEQR